MAWVKLLRAGFTLEALDDALTHFVEVLPLDLEAGGFHTKGSTKHSSITVNFAQTRQQQAERFLSVSELFQSFGLEQVDVHVHADELRNLQSLGRTV